MLVNLGNGNGVGVGGGTINREFKKLCSKEILGQGLILSTVTSPSGSFLPVDPPLEDHSSM